VSAASTPPFLLWAIGCECPIRGFQDGSDPEMTERQLRAAIATSEARRNGRLFEGYAVDEPLAFRVGEALAIYRGLATVEETCGACPVNATAVHHPQALAGCVGTFALPENDHVLYGQIERVIETYGLANEYAACLGLASPRWFGFWMSSPLTTDQTRFLHVVLDLLPADFKRSQSIINLDAGVFAACDRKLPFHARLYPRGTIESNWWRLATHCPRCTAEWKSVGRGMCEVCGYDGHPAPDKKRRARGRRPYLPLERLMGAEKAAEFLQRYRSSIQ
jgi:hypothetical protein